MQYILMNGIHDVFIGYRISFSLEGNFYLIRDRCEWVGQLTWSIGDKSSLHIKAILQPVQQIVYRVGTMALLIFSMRGVYAVWSVFSWNKVYRIWYIFNWFKQLFWKNVPTQRCINQTAQIAQSKNISKVDHILFSIHAFSGSCWYQPGIIINVGIGNCIFFTVWSL